MTEHRLVQLLLYLPIPIKIHFNLACIICCFIINDTKIHEIVLKRTKLIMCVIAISKKTKNSQTTRFLRAYLKELTSVNVNIWCIKRIGKIPNRKIQFRPIFHDCSMQISIFSMPPFAGVVSKNRLTKGNRKNPINRIPENEFPVELVTTYLCLKKNRGNLQELFYWSVCDVRL